MECLQELDLRRNLIGDLGALILLDALQQRKEGRYSMRATDVPVRS